MPAASPLPGTYPDSYTNNWNNYSNTGSYIGVPDAYRVQQGAYNDPAMAAHYGVSQAIRPIYGQPTYTYSMMNSLWGKPKGQVWETQAKLYSLGYLKSFTPGTMGKSTEAAFMRAAEDANKNGTTWEQMLGLGPDGKPRPGGGGSSGGGGGGGGAPTSYTSTNTSTQRSVNLTSREGAWSVLSNALASELGRAPTEAELTRFTKALNTKEQANPTVTKGVSTTHVTGHNSSTSSNSTTKQGNVDTAYQADKFGQTVAPAEYNRFQDSQYFNVIAQMIGAK